MISCLGHCHRSLIGKNRAGQPWHKAEHDDGYMGWCLPDRDGGATHHDRLDQKLARIRAGLYQPGDFIIADAKDPDMGPSLTATGKRADGKWRTRGEFLDTIRAIVRQGVVDIMLASASNLEI